MTRPGLTLLSAALLVSLAGCSTGGDFPSPVAPANSIFVSRGDTVHSIAQQYKVPTRDLIEANGLTAPYVLQPGQRLVLPVPQRYTVQAGDTLYGISRRFGVDMTSLVRLNNIASPYIIRTGETLRLPGGTGPQSPARVASVPAPARVDPPPSASPRSQVETATLPPPTPVAPPVTTAPATRPPASTGSSPSAPTKRGVQAETLPPVAATAPATATPPAPTVSAPATTPSTPAPAPVTKAPVPAPAAAPPTQVATATPPVPEAPPARAAARFLWPVKGKILSGFGDKPGGLRNDGINIEAASGTAVAAADNGTVAYAGNQLKSFGNLVLIRHAGGWVTVYAHLNDIAVQQGQQVTRGQVIGTVGQSGNVRSPQLHFAVRKGEQVVNPLDQLEK